MSARRTAAWLLAAALVPGVAAAAGGGDPFAFLLIPGDARTVALGGAGAAAEGDGSSVFSNPAGLATLRAHGVGFTHNRHFSGMNHETFWAAMLPGWGLGATTLDYGDIPRTTLANPTGAGLGQYGAREIAFSLGYGASLTQTYSVGGAAKYVREQIDGYSASGAAVDLGARAELRPRYGIPLALGIAVQNLGVSQPSFRSKRETLPVRWRAAAAYRLGLGEQALVTLLEFEKTQSDSFLPHAGVEWLPTPSLALRAGYDGRANSGPGARVGLGWDPGPVSFHYSFAPFGELGDAHWIGMTLSWGKADRPAHETKRRPAAEPAPGKSPLPWYYRNPKPIGG